MPYKSLTYNAHVHTCLVIKLGRELLTDVEKFGTDL